MNIKIDERNPVVAYLPFRESRWVVGTDIKIAMNYLLEMSL